MALSDRVRQAADDLLAGVVAAFADAEVILPDRRIVVAGASADDCEQVAVEVARLFVGLPGQAGAGGASGSQADRRTTWSVELRVRIVRCVPTSTDAGDPPSVAELDASSEALFDDAEVLADGILNKALDRTLFPSIPEATVELEAVEAIGPTGGAGGWAMTVSVGLV